VAALQRHDTRGARKELAIACRLLPELETTSGPILAQLWKSATDRPPGDCRAAVRGPVSFA
jgi:hypothetical protein